MFSITMLPAEDGDCLFVEANGFRTLIDGGRAATGADVLPSFLSSLPDRPRRPTIDLLVLSHVDADHIEGLLALIAKPGAVTFGEVWFNGIGHHKGAASSSVRPPRRPATGEQVDEGVLSIEQAMRFDSAIQGLGVPWNGRFAGGPVMIKRSGVLPRFELAEGVWLVLLGPSRSKLADFYPEWKAHAINLRSESVLTARPRQLPTVDNLLRLAVSRNVRDRSRPNGASIAFVIETERKRALFAADAHPDDLAKALNRYDGTDGPVRFDAIKVPHHGSAKNNTSQLIDKLSSPRWLISSNGSRHGHPDEEALARIVLAEGQDKRLIFNYASPWNTPWSAPALQAKFNYTTDYGNGISPYRVDLL